jgi:hypothetical protein
MNTSFSLLQKGLGVAFLRLQVWFDPAYNGSPYETFQPKNGEKSKNKYPLFFKRLSIRV